ncbi:sulfatase-like hydrolase/transferase [Novipirellula artificiosorum]|uniref:Arylsulfatase n=1 Tax=Novipirellula artificiosorum TaxID=2528016 RepID=A0A5C6D1Q6_9BACT|nr:Arylsulfatase [Novipirellula artificiosorum]
MTRSHTNIARFSAAVCLTLLLGFGSTLQASQPNIVFVFTDDLGWGDLGVFYQNESKHDKTHQTPHLDRLAAGGLQMRAHHCPAPVCAPSRSSLLTGVHQGNAVVRNNQFDKALEDNHTLGSVLREAGYRTCMIGKFGLQGGPKEKQQTGTPADWPAYPTKRGFDEFFGYVSHYAGHLHYPNDPWHQSQLRAVHVVDRRWIGAQWIAGEPKRR